MKNTKVKQMISDLPDIGCEAEDISYAIAEEAEYSRSWINDAILRRYMKETGSKRLSADERKLIKARSYDEYVTLSKRQHRDFEKRAERLLSELREKLMA